MHNRTWDIDALTYEYKEMLDRSSIAEKDHERLKKALIQSPDEFESTVNKLKKEKEEEKENEIKKSSFYTSTKAKGSEVSSLEGILEDVDETKNKINNLKKTLQLLESIKEDKEKLKEFGDFIINEHNNLEDSYPKRHPCSVIIQWASYEYSRLFKVVKNLREETQPVAFLSEIKSLGGFLATDENCVIRKILLEECVFHLLANNHGTRFFLHCLESETQPEKNLIELTHFFKGVEDFCKIFNDIPIITNKINFTSKFLTELLEDDAELDGSGLISTLIERYKIKAKMEIPWLLHEKLTTAEREKKLCQEKLAILVNPLKFDTFYKKFKPTTVLRENNSEEKTDQVSSSPGITTINEGNENKDDQQVSSEVTTTINEEIQTTQPSFVERHPYRTALLLVVCFFAIGAGATFIPGVGGVIAAGILAPIVGSLGFTLPSATGLVALIAGGALTLTAGIAGGLAGLLVKGLRSCFTAGDNRQPPRQVQQQLPDALDPKKSSPSPVLIRSKSTSTLMVSKLGIEQLPGNLKEKGKTQEVPPPRSVVGVIRSQSMSNLNPRIK